MTSIKDNGCEPDDDIPQDSNGFVPDDDTYSPKNVAACNSKIDQCLAEITRMLDGDFGTAIQLFRAFAAELRLPRDPRRAKPNAARDARLLKDYENAPRGTRAAVLTEFETRNRLKPGSAKRIVMRERAQSPERVFAPALRRLRETGDLE